MGPDPSLTPELIQARAFTSGFRGYDPGEVRDFLHRVASEIRALRERTTQLESAWHSAEERAARPPVLDEDTLMAAVGEETASILRAARGAAAEMRSRAADDGERIVGDARAEGERIRADAEGVLTRETQVAEDAAARIVEAARTEAAEMVDKARADADAIRDSARHEKQLTIDGATSTRERILEDLSRRRRVASVQIEQLRAGRERLLESYAVVRRTLEEVHSELTRADAEARAAADEAGRRMHREYQPESTPDASPATEAAEAGPNGSAGESSQLAEAAEAGEAGDHSGEAGDHSGEAGDHAGEERDAPPDTVEAAQEAVSPDDPPADGAPTAVPSATTTAAGTATATVTAPARTKRRSGGRGGGPSAAQAEALAPAEASAVPHLRVVPDPIERPGSKVDQLFARIRAGRAERAKAPGLVEQPEAEEEAALAVAPESGTAADEVPEPSETPEPDNSEAPEASGAPEASEPSEPTEPTEPETRRSDEDEALLQRREEALTDLEMSLTRKLKRALQDEHNDLLDRLRNLRGEPTAARLLPNRDDQIARNASAAQPLVDKAAAAGVGFAVQTLGRKGRANASAPPVADLARDAATSIVDALRRRLEQAISAAIGDEQQVMVESVGGAYREWKSQRVERIAGDSLAAAFARGTWSEAPDGTVLRWIVDDADGPCPDCDDDALAGGLPKGESFPTGQPHPPAHSGCRCLLVPVAQ